MAQPQQPGGGFNWAALSMGTKGLLITGVLMIVSVFLPWADLGAAVENVLGVDLGDFGGGGTLNAMQVSFLGTLALLLSLALVVWEGLQAFGARVNMGATSPALMSAIIGWITAALALIVFLQSLDGLGWGAFVGLVVALAMAYAAYVRFQESKVGTAPPPAA